MTAANTQMELGAARSDGPSVQEVLALDVVAPPPELREGYYEYLGSEDIPVERYTSQAWHDLEVERLWRKVWQVACGSEDIPNVGDTTVYDIAEDSLVIVRSAPNQIRAFHNVCLHRGTTLVEEPGHVERLRCPFHGFTWDLDGRFVSMPCRWDFPHVDAERFHLPEAKVDTWGGWVFVNMDSGCMPLSEFLGRFPEKFPWDHDHFTKQAHVSRLIACNWKVAMEAFLESFHVVVTHPQLLMAMGDANTQYDVLSGERRWNRMITAQAVPSPHLSGEPTQQELVDNLLGMQFGPGASVALAEGQTARGLLAMLVRTQLQGAVAEGSVISDSEALDAIQYHVFPNFVPWGGYSRINYRFRPDGSDPNSCIMEVMMLSPFDPAGPRPSPAAELRLAPDQDWGDGTNFGLLADVFRQDMANLPRLQKGLRATRKAGVTLGDYQEVRIRHFHRELGRWLDPDGEG